MNDKEMLLQRVRDGDVQAEAELVHEYVNRLLKLARSRLRAKLARGSILRTLFNRPIAVFFVEHARVVTC